MKKNIVIIGHVCIDHNISENSSYTSAGSPAMFISKTYKQFDDVEVSIIAPYGSDFLKYKDDITIYPTKPNITKTLVYKNDTQGGSRTQQALFRDESVPVKITPQIASVIKQADVIFVAPLLPNYSGEYLKEISKHKKKDSLVILSPQGYYRDFDKGNNVIPRKFKQDKEIIPLIDVLITSEHDSPEMEKQAANWSSHHSIVSIVTLAEKGAVVYSGKEKILMPTKKIPEEEVVDSVGAGDVFSAAFAYQYSKSKLKGNSRIKQAVRFAHKIAKKSLYFKSDDIQVI